MIASQMETQIASNPEGQELDLSLGHFLRRNDPASVGSLAMEPWNFMTFHSVGNVIVPFDEIHHFSEG